MLENCVKEKEKMFEKEDNQNTSTKKIFSETLENNNVFSLFQAHQHFLL